ncbi:MAG: AMP-binding protein, partial [Bacteroidales bacterium]|nr:AMP-binding protein [Bacteroidales bacterium]
MKSIFIEKLLETAACYEDKVALVDLDGSRSTTYGQLLALAKKVAAYLRQQGVAPHSNVCIRMPDTMEFMAAELGVWLSRCVAVPIGMNSPQERVLAIARNCGSVLLIDEEVMRKIKDLRASDPEETTLPESTDDALIVYTSGSTGIPKGIVHTFEPFDKNYPHTFGLAAPSPEIVFGNGVPFYFMAIVFLYDMLRAGATVHLYSANVKTDAKALQNYIMAHGITVSHISPAVLLHFLNRSSKLKAVITAGEKLTTQYSKDGYKLYNHYGLSETFGTVTSFEVGPSPVEKVPLGVCNPGIEFRIVGENGADVPIGEEGELYLKGSFCKGYYKAPELTQRLYADGWLHTGDIVIQGFDGLLYYRNRKDWMVKVNGQRVEPGEVETAIRKLPDVENAIVKGFDNDKGSQYLCAFYISKREIDHDEFRVHLDRLIPKYMHPVTYVKMDSFPLNANGKVNRLILNAPVRKVSHASYE